MAFSSISLIMGQPHMRVFRIQLKSTDIYKTWGGCDDWPNYGRLPARPIHFSPPDKNKTGHDVIESAIEPEVERLFLGNLSWPDGILVQFIQHGRGCSL